MRRDGVVPFLLGLLAVLTLPAAGLLPVPLDPATFLRLALLVTAFALFLVAPWARGRGTPGRLLLVAVVATPFLAFGILESPTRGGAMVLPGPAWALVLVVALLVVLVPPRPARILTVLFLTLWASDALLRRAGAAILPDGWNPAELPLERVEGDGRTSRTAAEASDAWGWREGAPIPVREETPDRALTEGPGPFFAPARRGRFPQTEPLVLVLGPAGTPAAELLTLPDVGVFVPEAEAGTPHALQLDAFDAAVVLPGAWPADAPDAADRANRLAVFTRRGGVLVGPGHGRDWPPPLGRRLGAAGRVRPSAPAGRAYGLGRVVQAASDEGMRQVLRDEVGPGATKKAVGTVFDPPRQTAPPLPPALARWQDEPSGRRDQGILLLVFALVAVALDRVLAGRAATRALALALTVLAVLAGVYWTSPGLPGVRIHAVALDLGGGGGRRVEALALAAGPAGWTGRVRWEGTGIVWVLGADLERSGEVSVPPGATAWVLCDRVSRGGAGDLEPSPRSAFLPGLLTGPLPSGRLEYGLSGPLPVRVGGGAPEVTWALRFRRSPQ